ncbi:Intradiol ring-cleavage dioxygenase [Plectosphaerella plurivora]|uniref:Intradiol ring-cleavage dioxygenase n=1 Tax=Plectosphaerella plurivora TaxID=936078 RepID=A0A9P8V9U4_9PEZI|nr:Intradiol ring-cleavage dioxygenase [Plectosphaerella plurivora]
MAHKYPVPEDLPPLKDLTIENITENVHAINSQCKDARTKFLFERLVVHLHDFARETRLSTSEWETSLNFLRDVGQICSPVRHEFILLSDILGLSLLVDAIDHPKPPGTTDGTVLGPFHTDDAFEIEAGGTVSHDPDGEPLFAVCSIKGTDGKPISNVAVDVWETDSQGFYDVQHADRQTPDGRAVLHSDEDGMICFNAIVPVPYPIPNDGPVGKLLKVLGRHPYRPSHMHFMFKKDGYDRLITALYLRGDPFESSDAVFGVKESLVVEFKKVGDVPGLAEKHGISPDMKLLQYDFVLITDEESRAVKDAEARKAASQMNGRLLVVDGVLLAADEQKTQ